MRCKLLHKLLALEVLRYEPLVLRCLPADHCLSAVEREYGRFEAFKYLCLCCAEFGCALYQSFSLRLSDVPFTACEDRRQDISFA